MVLVNGLGYPLVNYRAPTYNHADLVAYLGFCAQEQGLKLTPLFSSSLVSFPSTFSSEEYIIVHPKRLSEVQVDGLLGHIIPFRSQGEDYRGYFKRDFRTDQGEVQLYVEVCCRPSQLQLKPQTPSSFL
jgi:hypothetical protein